MKSTITFGLKSLKNLGHLVEIVIDVSLHKPIRPGKTLPTDTVERLLTLSGSIEANHISTILREAPHD